MKMIGFTKTYIFLNITAHTHKMHSATKETLQQLSKHVVHDSASAGTTEEFYDSFKVAAERMASDNGKIKNASINKGIATTEKILRDFGFKFEKIEGQDKQMRAVLK
jgi:hypothetical protein